MNLKRAALLITVAILIAIFFAYDLGRFLDLDYIKSQQANITAYYAANPWQTILIYFSIYVAVTALSLPGAAVMTLIGGGIFGLWIGTAVVSFASTIGATLAFLLARFLFRETVQERFASHLKTVNRGVEKDGALYLFTLRLVPLFPFFIINLVMGLTPMPALQFFLVSQVGMLAGTLVYVNAGTQLAAIESASGILSPGLVASFVLLGLFPLLAKKGVEIMKARRALSQYQRPRQFDRNLIVIGAGSGGLVSSYIAAAVKSKVTLIEKHKMGGDCLNSGCVPSKALIRTTKFLSHISRAKELGIDTVTAKWDFAQVMERVQRVIQQVEPHDSVERYSELGVECLQGEAHITSPYSVEVNGQTLTTRSIVVATGARPLAPRIPGLEQVGYLTSDTIWGLRKKPERLLVFGGGPIGCELAQAFSRLGSRVSIVVRSDRIMKKEDIEIAQQVRQRFEAEGIELLLEHSSKEFLLQDGRKSLLCEHHGKEVEIEFDELLMAAGRAANTSGFGLEELNIALRRNGTIEVDEFMRTSCPTIYACGDVTGPFQFTHTASHQAWYASVNALFGRFKRFRVDYSVIPWCTFTDPEVARVGLNEQEAKAQGIGYEVTTYGIDDLDRAITDEEAHGLVKILTVPGRDKILGVTIVGEHAGDLLAEYVLAMRHGLGLNKILGTIHIYPTLAEANKYAAGEWKRAHAPQRLLQWVERYHRWMRG